MSNLLIIVDKEKIILYDPVFDSLVARKPPESLTIQRFRRFCLCCFFAYYFLSRIFFSIVFNFFLVNNW